MYLQAQRAFGVSPDRHYRLLHAAAEEKSKIVVLTVLVMEADGLEAKDANGKCHIPVYILSFSQRVFCFSVMARRRRSREHERMTERADIIYFANLELNTSNNDKARRVVESSSHKYATAIALYTFFVYRASYNEPNESEQIDKKEIHIHISPHNNNNNALDSFHIENDELHEKIFMFN